MCTYVCAFTPLIFTHIVFYVFSTGAIWESTNNGTSFTQVGHISDSTASSGICCTTLFELPVQIGVMPAGVLCWPFFVKFIIVLLSHNVYSCHFSLILNIDIFSILNFPSASIIPFYMCYIFLYYSYPITIYLRHFS